MRAVFTEEPDIVWTHPHLSGEEQRKTAAECTMLAHEAIPHSNIAAAMEKGQYLEACLLSRGFVQSGVDTDPE